MITRRQIIDTFGEDRDGRTVLVCPSCEDYSTDALEQWKEHMTELHGGYDTEQVAAALHSAEDNKEETYTGSIGSTGSTEPEKVPPPAPPKPKKLSARARELNEKANRCLSLLLSHITTGISTAEKVELEENRRVLLEAFIGIQFDFDQRLLTLEGKMALIVLVACLYVIPMIPSMGGKLTQALKESMDKAKAKQQRPIPMPPSERNMPA